MSRILAAAVAALLLMAAPAHAQVADTGPFVAACNSEGGKFFGLESDDAVGALCTCLAGEFSARPQADVDILTKDLVQQSTDADHAAHGSYEAVEEAARDSVDKCAAGLTAAAETPGPAHVAPDMANFDASCTSSARLKDYLASSPVGAEVALKSACGCASAEFSNRFSQPVVDFLGAQLTSGDTPPPADPSGEIEKASQAAESIMVQCITAANAGQ